LRSDGLAVESGSGLNPITVTIQGTRSYNNSTGQWTTPDAYEGEIEDPLSQRSYVWNRNNPVKYSDPSGFDPYLIVDGGAAGGYGHMMIAIINHDTGRGSLYSQGPPQKNQRIGQSILKLPVTLDQLKGEVAGMKLGGMLTEQTSASADSSMRSRADQLKANADAGHGQYNVLLCNCDQFVKDVLSKADPAAASRLHVVPISDFSAVLNSSSLRGKPPNGFVPVDPGN